MATLRNKWKLAAVSRETQNYSTNSQLLNTFVPGITEKKTAQFSEKNVCEFTKKLLLEFSRTESGILGALSKLDEFLLKSQVRKFSGTVPGTCQIADVENQKPSGDRSQNDPNPEVEFLACRASNVTASDQDKISHTVPQEKTLEQFF